MKSGFMYIWEYNVRPEHTSAFVEAYKPEGTWGKLFRRAEGYIRTELHRDIADPQRFVTIDYWISVEAWKIFRKKFAQEFEAIDAKGESWTASEHEIGRFEPVP